MVEGGETIFRDRRRDSTSPYREDLSSGYPFDLCERWDLPEMNTKRCIKCLVHGDASDHFDPHCSRAECDCRKCELISLRRDAVNKLKVLSKRNSIDFGADEIFHTSYTCSKCRHHGVLAIKKFHVPCPFTACRCEWCEVNEQKRKIDAEIMQIQRSERRGECPHTPSTPSGSESEESPVRYEAYLSPEAKVIHDLLNILSVSPSSFNPSLFDYQALSNFFAQPLILVPEEWIPDIETIFELVHEALKRFPILQGIYFQLSTPYCYSYPTPELYSPSLFPDACTYFNTPLPTPVSLLSNI